MKIIQNNYPSLIANIGQTIVGEVSKSEKLDFMVAYVKNSGLNVLSDHIKNKNIRIICSLDMGTTDLSALKSLIENYSAEIRVCKLPKGTFHSKMWIFDKKTCLIGSANMTLSAFTSNVETSILFDDADNSETIKSANEIFQYFWKLTHPITGLEISNLILNRKKVKEIKIKTKSTENLEPSKIAIAIRNNILDFVSSWAEMDVSEKDKSEISKVWRGWYIIPDHGYVDDVMMLRLQKICKHIHDKGGTINISKGSDDIMALENLLANIKKFKRAKLKTPMRGLFIRQEKNYMEKFEFIYLPNRATIELTAVGKEIANTDNIQTIKSIYTKVIKNKEHYGLNMYDFTKQCLENCDGYLTYEEFNWFVCHAMESDDFSLIVSLIREHRKLKNAHRQDLKKEVDDVLKENKEHTNKGVVMNYNKSVKFTMSALGWTDEIHFDSDELRLKFRKSNVENSR